MTPEIVGQQLVNKYVYALLHGVDDTNLSIEKTAKKCALICCNEIITSCTNTQVEKDYWQQVKQEIEKL